LSLNFDNWDASRACPSQEKVMVTHLCDEVRRIMWNFFGIVRSEKLLHAARMRLSQIQNDVILYYNLYLISSYLIEFIYLIAIALIIFKLMLSSTTSTLAALFCKRLSGNFRIGSIIIL
jgi:L-aspartate oxidase